MNTNQARVRHASTLFAGLSLLMIAGSWLASGSQPVQAAPSDIQAVESAVRDYIEGWYTGDVDRMDRALHDELVKRMPVHEQGAIQLHQVPKARMLELTADGGGENPEAAFEIFVDDVSGAIATARVRSPEYLDYLHLVKTGAGWEIANVLFRTVE